MPKGGGGLSCNLCWSELQAPFIVTSCGHAFCEKHKTDASLQASTCPGCGSHLPSHGGMRLANYDVKSTTDWTVLNGLRPELVLKIADRAVGFWVAQERNKTAAATHALNEAGAAEQAEVRHEALATLEGSPGAQIVGDANELLDGSPRARIGSVMGPLLDDLSISLSALLPPPAPTAGLPTAGLPTAPGAGSRTAATARQRGADGSQRSAAAVRPPSHREPEGEPKSATVRGSRATRPHSAKEVGEPAVKTVGEPRCSERVVALARPRPQSAAERQRGTSAALVRSRSAHTTLHSELPPLLIALPVDGDGDALTPSHRRTDAEPAPTPTSTSTSSSGPSRRGSGASSRATPGVPMSCGVATCASRARAVQVAVSSRVVGASKSARAPAWH